MIQIQRLHAQFFRKGKLSVHIVLQPASAVVCFLTGLAGFQIPAVGRRDQHDPNPRIGLAQISHRVSQGPQVSIFIIGIPGVLNGRACMIVIDAMLDQHSLHPGEVHLRKTLHRLRKALGIAFRYPGCQLYVKVPRQNGSGKSYQGHGTFGVVKPALCLQPGRAGPAHGCVVHIHVQKRRQPVRNGNQLADVREHAAEGHDLHLVRLLLRRPAAECGKVQEAERQEGCGSVCNCPPAGALNC